MQPTRITLGISGMLAGTVYARGLRYNSENDGGARETGRMEKKEMEHDDGPSCTSSHDCMLNSRARPRPSPSRARAGPLGPLRRSAGFWAYAARTCALHMKAPAKVSSQRPVSTLQQPCVLQRRYLRTIIFNRGRKAEHLRSRQLFYARTFGVTRNGVLQNDAIFRSGKRLGPKDLIFGA